MIPSDIEKLIGEWAEEYDMEHAEHLDDSEKRAFVTSSRRLYAHFMSRDGEFDPDSLFVWFRETYNHAATHQDFKIAEWQFERDRAVIASLRVEKEQMDIAAGMYSLEIDALKAELAEYNRNFKQQTGEEPKDIVAMVSENYRLRAELAYEKEQRRCREEYWVQDNARLKLELAAAKATITRLEEDGSRILRMANKALSKGDDT